MTEEKKEENLAGRERREACKTRVSADVEGRKGECELQKNRKLAETTASLTAHLSAKS